MAQVKKEEVRLAILESAKKLYSKNGYVATSMNAIAKGAKISTSNMYNYFDSKLEILFAIYTPWLTEHFRTLEHDIQGIDDPRERIKAILLYLWVEVPASDNGFANNLNQALSVASPSERYSRELLMWAEAKVSRLLEPCLKSECKKYITDDIISHLIFMAFDGFVMAYDLPGPHGDSYRADRVDKLAEMMADLLTS